MHCGPIWNRNRKLRRKDSSINTLYSQENVIYHSKNYIPVAIDIISYSRDEDSANEQGAKKLGETINLIG